MREIEANGLTFQAREAGEGEPVMLLHGFPETSHMWVRLMDDLAAAGYHSIAPNQRGYSPGARPEDVSEYRYENLGGDVLAIGKAAGFDRFHLVGHDWGAGAGWLALGIDPSPIQSWTAMSVPHIEGFARAVYDDADEELYRGFLGMLSDPNTAATMAGDDCAGLRAAAWTSSSPEEVDDYVSVFRDPKAMQGGINWYLAGDMHKRAFTDDSFPIGPVDTPTLMIRGVNDPYVRQMAFDYAEPYMKGPYRVVNVEAGHWLIQEAYEQCRDEILAHLRENAL